MSSMVAALAELIELILPLRCVGCGGADAPAHLPHVPLCRSCHESLRQPAHHVLPSPAPPGLPPPWSVAPYEATVRSTIVAYKERGRVALDSVLGGALTVAVLAARRCLPGGSVLLVPVPTQQASSRRRGFDPLERLVRVATRELGRHGVPAQSVAALRYARTVRDQAGLGASGRAANLAGALEVPYGRASLVRGRAVLLVDDVITTGATLAEAARALRVVGAEVPCAAVIAATRRRGAAGP